MSGLFRRFILFLIANNLDPNQTPHHVASDLCLLCLPLTLFAYDPFRGFRVKWVKLVMAVPIRPHKGSAKIYYQCFCLIGCDFHYC